ncbi:MAG: SigB/SigF/SigG family RNA polymerase sigma factor [Lachnospiraceae bacterium]|nr:SigB/SigF/SigG family RNA polymerase sigma factor [Lachnospiraceae bacterium]
MSDMRLFQLAKEGDRAAKEKIVSENTGLVWSIARRYMGRGYDLEEIYQIGCIGLLKAIDRFDSEYEVMFSTYAVPLITGEIKRFLRDNGAIKVSRILKQNGYAISKARNDLNIQMGREPTMDELSEYTGLSKEEIVEAVEANQEVESIYQPIESKGGGEMYLLDRLEDGGQSAEMGDKALDRIMLSMAMEKLDELQRSIITKRYFEDRTQTQTAVALGLSQVQVSRLEKKTLQALRSMVEIKSN